VVKYPALDSFHLLQLLRFLSGFPTYLMRQRDYYHAESAIMIYF
jgi:hypothetical protein